MKYFLYSKNDDMALGYHIFSKETFVFSKPYKNDSRFIWFFSICGCKFILNELKRDDIKIKIYE